MKKVFLCVLAVALLPGLVACARPIASGEVIQSEKQRITSPEVDTTELTTLVNGNSPFIFLILDIKTGAYHSWGVW